MFWRKLNLYIYILFFSFNFTLIHIYIKTQLLDITSKCYFTRIYEHPRPSFKKNERKKKKVIKAQSKCSTALFYVISLVSVGHKYTLSVNDIAEASGYLFFSFSFFLFFFFFFFFGSKNLLLKKKSVASEQQMTIAIEREMFFVSKRVSFHSHSLSRTRATPCMLTIRHMLRIYKTLHVSTSLNAHTDKTQTLLLL